MIRLACLLQLVSLGVALSMVIRTNGATATAHMFVAGPFFVVGLAIYGYWALRERARNPIGLPKKRSS